MAGDENGTDLARLQSALRELRVRSGLTLRGMEPIAAYTASALSRATTGRRRPSWSLVEGYLRACGGDAVYFRELWEAAETSEGDDTGSDDGVVPPDEAEPVAAAPPVGPGTGATGRDPVPPGEQPSGVRPGRNGTQGPPGSANLADGADATTARIVESAPTLPPDPRTDPLIGGPNRAMAVPPAGPPGPPPGPVAAAVPPGAPAVHATTGIGPVPPVPAGSGVPGGPPRDARPGGRRRGRLLAGGLAALLVVALVIAGAVFGPMVFRSPAPPPQGPVLSAGQCAPDVFRRGTEGECAGFTDGSYGFAPELGLAPILAKIKEQNDEVFKSRQPSVSIAYVAAFPRRTDVPTAALALEEIRKELVGVLLAQLRANGDFSTGATPKIRVLVANIGAGGGQWRPVVQSLAAQATLPNRLVAVTGLGAGAEQAQISGMIAEFAKRKIPMFPSRSASDVLGAADRSTAGLFQVSPTPAAEAAIIANHAAAVSDRVLVVTDQAAGNSVGREFGDAVSNALRNRPDATLLPPLTLTSTDEGPGNAFVRLRLQICSSNAQTVVFAGRGVDAPAFLEALGARSCLDRPLTVLTNSDGVTATLSLRKDVDEGRLALAEALRSGRVTFRYTGLVHRDTWKPPQFAPAATVPFTGTCAGCLPTLFPGDRTTEDGIGPIAYDATLVPITALRMADLSPTATANPYSYTLDLVLRNTAQFTGSAPVSGATGQIAFDAQGDVVDKIDPIVELGPDGRAELVQ